jgi:hypothetical protein
MTTGPVDARKLSNYLLGKYSRSDGEKYKKQYAEAAAMPFRRASIMQRLFLYQR